MGPNDPNQKRRPLSIPPKTRELDDEWGEDIFAGTFSMSSEDTDEQDEEGDAHDRITAVPALPPDEYVARAMADAQGATAQALRADPAPGANKWPDTLAAELGISGRPHGPRRYSDSLDPPLPETLPPEDLIPDSDRITIEAPLPELDDVDLELEDDLDISTPVRQLSLSDDPGGSGGRPRQAPRKQVAATGEPDVAQGLSVSEEFQLEAVDDPPPSPPEDELLARCKDSYAVGDFTGALEAAEQLLAKDPMDLEAARYAQSCRDVLTEMYSARVGCFDQVVEVCVSSERIRWLSLDHRSGFLLSLVDGSSTVEELLDISGMPALDALRILAELTGQGILRMKRR